ncbi:MAG: efflux transporter outer membrane subunit, partial [Rhizobacter sp.]|nr:efflux transporter outer membrane subunit [Rhizobacter sp.]
MHSVFRGVVAVFALALAGCSFIPTYRRPAAPVAPTYPAETAPDSVTGGAAAADVDFHAFFADARLKRLVELSLVNNRDLRVAVLNIEQARATYDIRRADLWPTVGAGVTAQRQPGVTATQFTTYGVGVAVSNWEVDLFGRVRALSQSALAQYFATAEARKAVHTSLVASVADAYLNVLADEELLRVTQDTLKTREESLRLTKLRFDNGVSSELDFRQAESLLEGARATLAQSQRQRTLDLNALVLLVGQPLPEDLPPALPLDQQQIAVELPAGLPSDLLVRRPDIRASEQQLAAANANIGAARAAFFPSISLTGSYGTASTQLSGLFKGGSWAFIGTAQALVPIFDAGRNRAGLELARANFDVAVAQYERSIQTAFREVSDALAGRATLGEQLRAQAAQTNALEAAYRLSDLRYRSGVASFLDTLDAARTLFAAQILLVQTQA